MNKNLSAFTFVYTSDRIDACGVRMYTDKSSEVCTVRFGNSFTLPVVTPQDLIDFAHEILSFAKDAHDFHYPELSEDERSSGEDIGEEIAQLQQKLDDCGVVATHEWTQINEAVRAKKINDTRARYLREEADFDPNDEVARVAYEEMGGISRASVTGIDKVPTEPYVPVEQDQSKVGKMMAGTITPPEWNPNDPLNW